MIPKAERDRDRATCEAAPSGEWEADDVAEDDDDEFMDISADDGIVAYAFTADAGKAICNAVNRLPLYIAALDEMERRINAIERMLTLTCEEAKEDPSGEDEWSRGHRSTLRGVVKILRGEK